MRSCELNENTEFPVQAASRLDISFPVPGYSGSVPASSSALCVLWVLYISRGVPTETISQWVAMISCVVMTPGSPLCWKNACTTSGNSGVPFSDLPPSVVFSLLLYLRCMWLIRMARLTKHSLCGSYFVGCAVISPTLLVATCPISWLFRQLQLIFMLPSTV